MPNNIRGITIEIGGDTTKLDKALGGVNKNVKSTQAELKEVEKLLKLDPKNTEALEQKQKLLAKAVSETKGKLDVLKTAEAQVQEQFRRGEVSEEQYRALKREIEATELSLKKLEEEANKSNISLEKVGGVFRKIGEKAKSLGKKLMSVTTAITGIGTAAGAMAISFEDALAKVSTIADETEVSMADMKAAILNLSDETGIAAEEIAENVYNAISAGQSTGDAVNFVSKATALAKAGFAESGDALDILTTIMNAYGMEAEKVTDVSDMLIQTQNLGKTTVAELSSAMGKVIPTAKAQGVTLDHLCAAYAVMTSNGIATAETTTYLNSMLNELGKSGTSAATAFAIGTEHIKEGGLTMAEAMEGGWELTDVLGILAEQADISGTTISNMFSSAEAGKAANVLWSNGVKLNDVLMQMGESAGSTETAFGKLNTTNNKIKISINQLKNMAIDLGGTLLDAFQPRIKKSTDKIKEFTDWFKKLNENQKQTIIKIAAVAAAIGPALIGFGKMSTGISKVIDITTKLKGVLGAGGGIAKVLTMLTGPVGIAIAAIAALAAGFVALYKTNDAFREKVDNALAKVKQAFSDMWVKVKPAIEQIKQAFSDMWVRMGPVVEQIKQAFMKLLEALQPVFEFILTHIGSMVNGVVSAGKSILSAIQNMAEKVGNVLEKVKQVFSDMWVKIKPKIMPVIEQVKKIKQAFMNLLEALRPVAEFILTFIGVIVKCAVSANASVMSAVKNVVNVVKTFLWPVFEFILTFIGSVVNGIIAAAAPILAAVKNVIDYVTNIVKAFTSLLSGDFEGVFSHIEAALESAIKFVINIILAWISSMVGFFEGFGIDIKKVFSDLWDGIVSIFKGVGQWFGDRFTEAYTDATRVFAVIGAWFGGRWTDIKAALSGVPAWFKTQFNNAWTNIKNVFANVTSFFSGLWDKIKGCFVDVGVKIGSAVGDAFKSAINSCLSTMEGIVNKFIGMINGVIGIVNAIPGVSLEKISTLSLPRLARGGVLREGQAMVAEAGPELLSMVNGKAVVTPLTGTARNQAMENAGNGGGRYVQNVNITSPKALSPYEVARQTRLQTRGMILRMQRG